MLKIDNNLRLVPITSKYAGEIFRSMTHEVIRYIPMKEPPAKIEETLSFIDVSVKQRELGTDRVWVILTKSEFAGVCGIHGIKTRKPHFGLWIKEDMQAMGTGRKVVRFMLPWAIQNLDIDLIRYPFARQNIRSRKLIEGMGLRHGRSYTLEEPKRLEIEEYHLSR